MSTPQLFDPQRLARTWNKRCDRATNLGYVARELLLAALLRRPKLRILFSEIRDMRPAIERWFRYTRHEIHFGQFLPEVLADYDLLVPLNMPDVRRLDAVRELTAHNLLPIPSREAITICDDKLLFTRFLVERGFGEFTPRLIDKPETPYVLKRRTDFAGQHTHVIRDRAQEHELLGDFPEQDYFRQELIPGRREYATHVLFLRNRVVRSLSFEYDMEQPTPVKGHRMYPKRQRMVRCPHLEVFAAILAAIGFEGLCCIDYKRSAGRPLIMEVNPRFGGSLSPYFFSFLRDLRPNPLLARLLPG